MTLKEFFHMGGYAFYVWTSYGIALIVLLLNVAMPMMQHRKVRKENLRRLRRGRETQ